MLTQADRNTHLRHDGLLVTTVCAGYTRNRYLHSRCDRQTLLRVRAWPLEGYQRLRAPTPPPHPSHSLTHSLTHLTHSLTHSLHSPTHPPPSLRHQSPSPRHRDKPTSPSPLHPQKTKQTSSPSPTQPPNPCPTTLTTYPPTRPTYTSHPPPHS